jgi:hypothetical protein
MKKASGIESAIEGCLDSDQQAAQIGLDDPRRNA